MVSLINNNYSTNVLNKQHFESCCGDDLVKGQRGLDREYIEANCFSTTAAIAGKKLGYRVPVDGLLLKGANGAVQFKPDWRHGEKGSKYLSVRGEYDLFLPAHPHIPDYWDNLEELKEKCLKIKGKPYLLITEGVFTAIAPFSHGIPCGALFGVRMGLTPKRLGPKKLVSSLQKLAGAGINFLLVFDADILHKKGVQDALKELGEFLKKAGAHVRVVRPWDENLGKGMDDFIVNEGIEEFRKQLEDTVALDEFKIESTEHYLVEDESVESVVLRKLFEDGKGNWVVLNDSFYRYNGQGSYKLVPDTIVSQQISDILRRCYSIQGSEKNGFFKKYEFSTESKLRSSFRFARAYLTKEGKKSAFLTAFADCTVDMRSGKRLPHNKGHYLTSSILSEYQINAECPEIYRNFLVEVFGEEVIPLVRAVTSMLLDPTAPYGKFPYLVGPSGSGKGTQLRLWESLLGSESVRSLTDFADFSSPEKRHQNLTGTRFAVFPDMGGYAKGLRAFYELVDNGSLSGRALFSSHGYQQRWNCRFAIASVEYLQIENSGDGWKRRCIPLPTKLRSRREDPELGKKLQEVRGEIVSWALAMDREERDRLLMFSEFWTESIKEIQFEQDIFSDSVRAFVDLSLRPCPEDNLTYENWQLHDYYLAFCKTHGFRAMSITKFISHLRNIIPYNRVERRRKRINGKLTTIKPHWRNLIPLPNAFSYDDLAFTQQRESICIKSSCFEGGLSEFKDFWLNPIEPDRKLTEPDTMKIDETQSNQDFQELNPIEPLNPIENKPIGVNSSPPLPEKKDGENDKRKILSRDTGFNQVQLDELPPEQVLQPEPYRGKESKIQSGSPVVSGSKLVQKYGGKFSEEVLTGLSQQRRRLGLKAGQIKEILCEHFGTTEFSDLSETQARQLLEYFEIQFDKIVFRYRIGQKVLFEGQEYAIADCHYNMGIDRSSYTLRDLETGDELEESVKELGLELAYDEPYYDSEYIIGEIADLLKAVHSLECLKQGLLDSGSELFIPSRLARAVNLLEREHRDRILGFMKQAGLIIGSESFISLDSNESSISFVENRSKEGSDPEVLIESSPCVEPEVCIESELEAGLALDPENAPWETYPICNQGTKYRQKRARYIKLELLRCITSRELELKIKAKEFSSREVEWVKKYFLTNDERVKWELIEKTVQLELLDEDGFDK